MNLNIAVLTEDKTSSDSFYSKTNFTLGDALEFTKVTLLDSLKINTEKLNVVIIDYDIAQADTFTFIEGLKQRSFNIPIIIVATQIDDLAFNQLLELDIYAYVEKDNNMKEVLIDYLLDIKKSTYHHATS